MSNKTFDSVWDAIEDTPAAAANMRLRSALMIALQKHINAEGLNQSQAAEMFGVAQQRVSDLLRGKINLFSLDTLLNMMAATPHKQDMAGRIEKVIAFAQNVFRDDEKVQEFLARPHLMLENKAPVDVTLATDAGADAVINLLGRAACGATV